MKALIFVGKAGSGKDTAAAAVLKAVSQLQTFKWADTLKDVACAVYGWDRALIDTSNDYKEEVPTISVLGSDGLLMPQPQCPGKEGKGLSRREVLQLLGTECFRETIADDTWLQAAWRRIAEIEEFARHYEPGLAPEYHNYPIRGWVNTDTRFPNESTFARERFDQCVVVKVERIGMGTLTESTQHASELAMDSIVPDAVIRAVDGDLEFLEDSAVEIATRFFRND